MSKNLLYALVILASLSFLFFRGVIFGNANVKSISANQLQAMMETDSLNLIDVRTPEEVELGYIKGTKLFIDYSSSDFEQKVSKLDKNKKYVVYCASGIRSAKSFKIMEKLGFTNILNLSGGFSSWNGPISK